jgi:lysophospholipase L1-like esterase
MLVFSAIVFIAFFVLLDKALKYYEKAARKAKDAKETAVVSGMLTPKQTAEYKQATDLELVPYLMFRMAPNFHSDTININSLGFRGRETTKEKPSGVYRIVILGGSGAMGYGSSSDETTFARVLEKLLNGRAPSGRFEVINAGMASAISAQELVLIVTDIIDLKPDMAVIFDSFNDIVGSVINDRRPNYPWRFETLEKALKVSPTKLFINKKLRNFRLTKLILERLEEKRKAQALAALSPNEAGVRAYVDNVNKMVTLLKGLGIEPVVIMQPNIFFKKNLSSEERGVMAAQPAALAPIARKAFSEADAEVGRVARDRGVVYSSFLGVFDDRPDTIFFDAVHVGDKGQQIIASGIYELLKKRLTTGDR